MAKPRILIVEDDEDILELVKYNLLKEGYEVVTRTCGEDALRTIRNDPPALVLLDLMLPGMDGLEVCRILKNDPNTSGISVIMLTARGEEADIVTGLEVGADDYITKPFSPRVLVARVKSALRRQATSALDETATIQIEDFVIHPGRHEVLVKGEPVKLTFTEFQILHLLARRPGWAFSRYQIVNAVRGEASIVTDRSVDVQIVGLRKKLGPYADYIETLRNVGYRFKDVSSANRHPPDALSTR
jgi:two-component system phosphate regulon response regulator PhoB